MSGLANLQFGPAQQNLANSPTMGPLFALWASQEQKNRMQQQSQAIQNNEYQNIQDALAAHQAQAMDNPNDIDVIRRGKLGEAFSKEATGKYDQGTVQSRIDTTLAENKNKISTAQTEQMMHELDKATAALQTNPQLGISAIPDPGLRKKVAELSQKGMHPMEVLQKFSDRLKANLANSPKFIADANIKAIEGNNQMNVKALDNQGALERTNVTAAATRYAADVGAESRKAAAESKKDVYTQITKLPPATRKGILAQALTTGIDPTTKEEMTPMAREGWAKMYESDVAETDRQANAQRDTKINLPAEAGLTPLPPVNTNVLDKPKKGKALQFNEKTGKWE